VNILKIKKLIKKKIFIFCVLLVCIAFSSCSEKKVSSTELAMNTVISITAYGDKADEAVKASFDEVKRIEKLLSCHIDDSEISKVNKSAFENPVEVSPETAEVLKNALLFCQKTNGAFDISIKPLADLWNIKAENPKVPSGEEINTVLSFVGYENICLNGNFVSFKKEGVQIDLGGAAKGYCADRIAEILKSFGVKNALIDLGGNIYAIGKNEQGKEWRIGLQKPGEKRGEYFSVEELSDKTAVTSGSYERYFEKDGRVYHHILDTQSGYPSESGLISVTVISKSSFEADMLSTAIFVMGGDEFEKIKDGFDFEKYITVDKYNASRVYKK
jgi:thiamine biosynthesis lipoprotein